MRVNTLLYQKQVEQKQPKQLRLETYKFGKLTLTVQASTCLRNDALKNNIPLFMSHSREKLLKESCTKSVRNLI